MPLDPIKIATEYGLPWGIAAGLTVALVFMYRNTVPNRVYDREVERNKALGETVQTLVADVRTLLALMQSRGE
jgi:hypothetical protein